MNLMFKTYSGSLLYGTNSPSSDIDIKGVFIPELNDLILNRAPKQISNSTSSENVKNTSEDVDETYYSIQYFLDLLTKGETNCLDLFFAASNKNTTLFITDKWKELLNNSDKIITKNINKYLGFCKSQAIKYSFKGEKLTNYKEFKNFCELHYHDTDENGQPPTLLKVLDDFIGHDSISNYIPNVGQDRISGGLTFARFGDHCYFLTAPNKESYISISDVKFGLNESIKDVYHKIKRTIESYGNRAELASNNNGADFKALSHSVRVLFQAEQLLKEGKITFPLLPDQIDLVKSIKYNTKNYTFDYILNIINEKMDYINNELLPKSSLREKADFKWIDQYILSLYK